MQLDRSSSVRVGLIGYGLAGAAFHAPLIRATSGLELAAIVTKHPERRRDASLAHPDAALLDSADDLWSRAADLELVVVATPNRTHVPLARAALAAGLDVVVDKPFAPTATEGQRLIDEARDRGRMLSVYHNRRWDGDFLTVQRLLSEGRLGDPLRFESRFERWRPVPKGGWRERPEPEEAGGLLYDLGSHLIDQALVLFGPATDVYSEMDCRRPSVAVDDDTFVALTHASGVRSHLFVSAVAAQPGARIRLLGSRAAYVKHGVDVQEAALRGTGRLDPTGWGEDPSDAWGRLGAGDSVEHIRTDTGGYQRFYEGVLHAIRTGGPPPVDPADAVAGLKIIEAARTSAAERRVVRLS
jgi:predicted dehydrogenase